MSGKRLPGQFLVRYGCGKVETRTSPSAGPRKTKLEIRNSKLGNPKSKPERPKKVPHPFKGQNRKGRPPPEKRKSKSSQRVKGRPPAVIATKFTRSEEPTPSSNQRLTSHCDVISIVTVGTPGWTGPLVIPICNVGASRADSNAIRTALTAGRLPFGACTYMGSGAWSSHPLTSLFNLLNGHPAASNASAIWSANFGAGLQHSNRTSDLSLIRSLRTATMLAFCDSVSQ